MTKHKVICVWGSFTKKRKLKGKWDVDFVLEPACLPEDNCSECKKAFWIYDEEGVQEELKDLQGAYDIALKEINKLRKKLKLQ